MISVIIPVSPNDSDSFVRSTFKGADEILVGRDGTWSEAQNMNAAKAKEDILLFIDADMDLLGTDVSKLDGPFEIASALYNSPKELSQLPFETFHNNLQNFSAKWGSPWMLIGGFMWMKKYVWQRVGGFRETWWPDVEFASRAYLLGFKFGFFDIKIVHTRPYSPRFPYIETRWIWGVP